MKLTSRAFKVILTLSWVVIVIGVIVDLATHPLLPEALREYREVEYGEDWTREGWLLFTVTVALGVAVVASYVGLYGLKPWGRSLWLWTGVAGWALAPVWGPVVHSGWAELFHFLAVALYGVILALVYFSPVAKMIEGEPHTPSNGGGSLGSE